MPSIVSFTGADTVAIKGDLGRGQKKVHLTCMMDDQTTEDKQYLKWSALGQLYSWHQNPFHQHNRSDNKKELCSVIVIHSSIKLTELSPLFLCSWLAQSSAVRALRSTRSGRCQELRSRSAASWTGQATAMSPSQEHRSASTWPSTSLPPGKAQLHEQPSNESLQEQRIILD